MDTAAKRESEHIEEVYTELEKADNESTPRAKGKHADLAYSGSHSAPVEYESTPLAKRTRSQKGSKDLQTRGRKAQGDARVEGHGETQEDKQADNEGKQCARESGSGSGEAMIGNANARVGDDEEEGGDRDGNEDDEKDDPKDEEEGDMGGQPHSPGNVHVLQSLCVCPQKGTEWRLGLD